MRSRLRLVLGVLAVLFVPACEHQVTEYPPQPAQTKDTDVDIATIRRHYVADVDEAMRQCNGNGRQTHYGCAHVYHHGVAPGHNFCEVWIVKPRDFNDIPRLALAGHEIERHCFGATHQ